MQSLEFEPWTPPKKKKKLFQHGFGDVWETRVLSYSGCFC